MRQAGGVPAKLKQPEGPLRPRTPVPARPELVGFVLGTPPLAEPAPDVCVDRPVGIADRTETEVTGPSAENAVELTHHLFRVQATTLAVRDRADPFAHSRDPFLAGVNATKAGA